jgi:Alpha/beta hydrolase family
VTEVVAWTDGVRRALPEVVFVPGLGAPGYLKPWARDVAGWTRATILDLPGWAWGRARNCPPTVEGVAAAFADWLGATGRRDVLLVGHSTAALAVARATRLVSDGVVFGAVLAGAVFDPTISGPADVARRLLRTAVHESPAEIAAVAPKYVSSGIVPLARVLADAARQRYTVRGRALILCGVHDGLAPPRWVRDLAERSGSDYLLMPGGHNFCFRHPRPAAEALRATAQRWCDQAATG